MLRVSSLGAAAGAVGCMEAWSCANPAQALGNGHGAFQAGVRHQDGKLLAADAAEVIDAVLPALQIEKNFP